MSLAIAIKGVDGIVLAADSRGTLTREANSSSGVNSSTVYYDNAQKLLGLSDKKNVGFVTYGAPAIQNPATRLVHSFLPEFEASLGSAKTRRNLSVEDCAFKLGQFFSAKWQEAQMPQDSSQMMFVIGGYDTGKPTGKVFEVNIPSQVRPVEHFSSDGEYGIFWGGQADFASRLYTGCDNRLPFILQEMFELTDQRRIETRNEIVKKLQADIPLGHLPLQNCVDLAILLLNTTVEMHKLIVGERGVGGPIDVATITPNEGFVFIQQKSITGESPNHR